MDSQDRNHRCSAGLDVDRDDAPAEGALDPRGVWLVEQATRLIAAGGAYRFAELGDIVDLVAEEVALATARLDHAEDCDGCELCVQPEETPEGTTLQ